MAPIPGIVVSRRAVVSVRAAWANSASNAVMRRSSSRHSARWSLDQQPRSWAEDYLLGRQQCLQMQLQLAPSLGGDDASFQQKSTHLIDQRRAFTHQSVARTMQALHVELLLTFQLDEPHCGPCRRFGNRLRIPVIVLLRP